MPSLSSRSRSPDDVFTIFAVLPTDEVCTLRNLTSGVLVAEVKCRLELIAGLPSHIYQLVYPDGECLADDQCLDVQKNIRDGYVLRICLLENWDSLFQSIVKNNVDHVFHGEGVHLKDDVIYASNNDCEKLDNIVYERSSVALFISSFLGLYRMTHMLLNAGTDVNCRTANGRTALHAAVCKDHLSLIDLLVEHGGTLEQTDIFGKTPSDIAHASMSDQCFKRIRLMQLNLRGKPINCVSVSSTPTRLFRIPGEVSRHVKYNGSDGKPRPATVSTTSTFKRLPASPSRSETFLQNQNRSQSSQGHQAWESLPSNGSAHVRVCDKSVKTSRTISACSNTPLQKVRLDTTYNGRDSVANKRKNEAFLGKQLSILRSKRTLQFLPDNHNGLYICTNGYRNIDATPNLAPEINRESSFPGKDNPKTDENEIHSNGEQNPENAKTTDGDAENQSTMDSPPKVKSRKAVRFSAYTRTLPARPKQETIEIFRSMKRKINIVSSQKIPKLNRGTDSGQGDTHEVWLSKKKSEEQKAAPDIDSSDESDGYSDTENNGDSEAFKKWLDDKKYNRNKPVRHITGNRPVHGIITIGSTEEGDARNPDPVYNIAAYKEWVERRKQKGANSYRMKTVQDFMSQRKKLEEKRQQLLMTVISYDEWVDYNEDKQVVIRQIMKADLEQLKSIEEEHLRKRTSRQIKHEDWEQSLAKRQADERAKFEIQRKYQQEKESWRRELLRSSAAVPHSEWMRTKRQQHVNKQDNVKTEKLDSEPANKNEKAYEMWLTQKHEQEISELQNKILKEKHLIEALGQSRTSAHVPMSAS